MSVEHYDRAAAVKAFDDTKVGVKGLVDAGVTKIPPFFIQPPEQPQPSPGHGPEIPVIDLTAVGTIGAQRERAAAQALQAAATFGFFQVVNHGIPNEVLDEVHRAAARFHEELDEVKRPFYTHDPRSKVRYESNFVMYDSPAACWRDALFCTMAPEAPHPDELPAVCRKELLEYMSHVQKLGAVLFQLLSEGLRLQSKRLLEMECTKKKILQNGCHSVKIFSCTKGVTVICQYYPPCPEPELTHRTGKHSDVDFLTILLHDQIGGLQVLHQDQWINVLPLSGSLVINIGDFLQLISNGKLKSVEHRVLAKKNGPRILVPCFFLPEFYASAVLYGPMKELISDENPTIYREVIAREYITYYHNKRLGKSALEQIKL